MATEPRIVSVTEFKFNGRKRQWYWRTKAANSKIVGDGAEGYHNLVDAVNGFFAQQGTTQEDQSYSELREIVHRRQYEIRKYDV